MKQTAVELQKYGTKGQISSTILIQLTFPIHFTSEVFKGKLQAGRTL